METNLGLFVRNPIVEKNLFGKEKRPHVLSVKDMNEASTIPGIAEKLMNLGYGYINFFGTIYVNHEDPTDNGYELPEGCLELIREIKAKKFKVLGYIHGPKWSAKHLGPWKAIDHLRNMEVDGVYLDNGEMQTNRYTGNLLISGPMCTLDFFKRLKKLNYTIIHHSTIEPWPGFGFNVQNRGPWNEYCDYIVNRENCIANFEDATWRHEISASTWCNAIGMPKDNIPPEMNKQKYLSTLSNWLCSFRTYTWGLDDFEKYYYPNWKSLSLRWQKIYEPKNN